jgi:hypothetical protein
MNKSPEVHLGATISLSLWETRVAWQLREEELYQGQGLSDLAICCIVQAVSL